MSNPSEVPGAIAWRDLTVPDATTVRDFYGAVVGWEFTSQDMGDYQDFSVLVPSTGETIAGICHARGENARIPAQWLMYVLVPDVDASAARCVERGGSLVDGPRDMGGSRFCVIRDPAGAVCALYAVPIEAPGAGGTS